MYVLTGVISCSGEDGTSQAGGASGGSIILNAHTFNGKGKVMANGGAGKADNSCLVFIVLPKVLFCNFPCLLWEHW